jgi:hypothetical protein
LCPRRGARAGTGTGARRCSAAGAAPGRRSDDSRQRGSAGAWTLSRRDNCHTPRLPDGTPDPAKNLAGAFVIEEPVFKAYAPNITPDMETGIGSWSEDDIVDVLHNARKPDGTYLGPPMSFIWYRNLSDTDARAIAKYIKSVPAVRNEVPRSTFQIPLTGFGPEVTSVPDVPKTDIVKYGEYLAGPVGHCMDCHTTYVMGQIDMAQLGRGGNVYSRPFIYDWAAVSANITSHPEAGLGAWTDDEIKRAITKGISRNGRELLPFMPYWLYDRMEPSDLDAIVAYLRSLPPLGPAAPAVPE